MARLPFGSSYISGGLCQIQCLPLLSHLRLMVASAWEAPIIAGRVGSGPGPPYTTKSCWGRLTSWGNLNQDGDRFCFLLPDEFVLHSFNQKVMGHLLLSQKEHVYTTSSPHVFPQPMFALFYPPCSPAGVTTHIACHHQQGGHLAPASLELHPRSSSPIMPSVLSTLTQTGKFMFYWLSQLPRNAGTNKHVTLVPTYFWD